MSEPNRQSDSALCRRIAEARGWTRIEWDAHHQWWYGDNPDVVRGYKTRVPCPDVDATACLELLDYFFSQRWSIQYADERYVRLTHVDPDYTCTTFGDTFMQAFARAAADALECALEAMKPKGETP